LVSDHTRILRVSWYKLNIYTVVHENLPEGNNFSKKHDRGTFGSTVALSFKRPITKREFEKWLCITPSPDKPTTPLFAFLNFVDSPIASDICI
jgi:hypothetical protein